MAQIMQQGRHYVHYSTTTVEQKFALSLPEKQLGYPRLQTLLANDIQLWRFFEYKYHVPPADIDIARRLAAPFRAA